MTDRRAERDRERREKKRAREAAERRLDELWEAWRRNHPSEEEEGKNRPHKGRHTYPQALAGGVGVRDDGKRLGR
jgi:hypothetical protein